MPDIEIRGADQLYRLSKALKAAGNTGLQRELSKAIAQAMKPLRNDLKQSARDVLPQRGGLAESVARSQMRIVKRASGIRFQTRHAQRALRMMDEGKVRHPVFGNREKWVTQTIDPNWWSKPIEQAGPEIRQAVLEAIDQVARKIERGY